MPVTASISQIAKMLQINERFDVARYSDYNKLLTKYSLMIDEAKQSDSGNITAMRQTYSDIKWAKEGAKRFELKDVDFKPQRRLEPVKPSTRPPRSSHDRNAQAGATSASVPCKTRQISPQRDGNCA